MKKLLLPLLLLLATSMYGQTNYYTFNSDSIFTESRIRLAYKTAIKNIPDNFTIVPTIYHKILKKDSVINYLSFVIERCDSCSTSEFKFTFKQEPLFLLLGKKLPKFTLSDLKGNEFSSSQLLGRPTMLNFWAIYCAPCVAEIPELNGLKEKYGDKMNFIALTESTCKDEELVKFLDKHPFNFIILGEANHYKKVLQISAIPRNIFLDKDGYIRYIQGNFPYKALDPANGIKNFDDNNYFTKIIEELIKEDN